MRKPSRAEVDAAEQIVREWQRRMEFARDELEKAERLSFNILRAATMASAEANLSKELKALYELGNGDLGKGLSRFLNETN